LVASTSRGSRLIKLLNCARLQACNLARFSENKSLNA
jgi:hypothetical protein